MQRSIRRRFMARMKRQRQSRDSRAWIGVDGIEAVNEVIDSLSQGWVGSRVAFAAAADVGQGADEPFVFGLPRL
jgi:hypothetical protein